jgi:hypothetical protein
MRIEGASVTLAILVFLTTSELANDTVVVVNEYTWALSMWTDLANLLFDPIKSRVLRYIEMYDLSESELCYDTKYTILTKVAY